jgi:hypothetical protein
MHDEDFRREERGMPEIKSARSQVVRLCRLVLDAGCGLSNGCGYPEDSTCSCLDAFVQRREQNHRLEAYATLLRRYEIVAANILDQKPWASERPDLCLSDCDHFRICSAFRNAFN